MSVRPGRRVTPAPTAPARGGSHRALTPHRIPATVRMRSVGARGRHRLARWPRPPITFLVVFGGQAAHTRDTPAASIAMIEAARAKASLEADYPRARCAQEPPA